MGKIFIKTDIDGKILLFKNTTSYNLNEKDIYNKRIYNFFYNISVLNFISYFEKLNTTFNDSFLFSFENNTFQSEVFAKKKNDSFLYFIIIPKVENSFYNYKISYLDRINVILRTKFVFGSLVPLFFSIFWSLIDYNNFSFKMLIPLIIGVFFFHVTANVFNDYFDWKSGRDVKNLDYVLFSTGGSRAIDLGLITEKKLYFLSIFCFLIVFLCGIYITYVRGLIILYIGLFSAFVVYFYSAPPIHFASRYGAGETFHIICLGPLIMIGSKLTLIGYFNTLDFLIGFPFGLLITACLLINEYPDSKYDKQSKKYNLAVLLGPKYIPILFVILVFFAYFIIIFSMFYYMLSVYFCLVFLTLPYFIRTFNFVFNLKNGRFFVSTSCIRSFRLYLYFSFLMIFAIIVKILF